MVEHFEQYESAANTQREELKELVKEVAALKAEKHRLARFFGDKLLKMYEVLGTRDTEMNEAVRSLLTMRHVDQCLHQQHAESMNRVEGFLAHQPLSLALNVRNTTLHPPASPASSACDENENDNPEQGELVANPHPMTNTNKRSTSLRPDDLDSAAKHLVFESLVWSGFLASRALDRNRNRSSSFQNIKKTEPDQCRLVFCGLLWLRDRSLTGHGLNRLSTGLDRSRRGFRLQNNIFRVTFSKYRV
jgi:hypothetical protein